jgi:hypothetical protein
VSVILGGRRVQLSSILNMCPNPNTYTHTHTHTHTHQVEELEAAKAAVAAAQQQLLQQQQQHQLSLPTDDTNTLIADDDNDGPTLPPPRPPPPLPPAPVQTITVVLPADAQAGSRGGLPRAPSLAWTLMASIREITPRGATLPCAYPYDTLLCIHVYTLFHPTHLLPTTKPTKNK